MKMLTVWDLVEGREGELELDAVDPDCAMADSHEEWESAHPEAVREAELDAEVACDGDDVRAYSLTGPVGRVLRAVGWSEWPDDDVEEAP